MCLGGISGREQHALNAVDPVTNTRPMRVRKIGLSHRLRRQPRSALAGCAAKANVGMTRINSLQSIVR